MAALKISEAIDILKSIKEEEGDIDLTFLELFEYGFFTHTDIIKIETDKNEEGNIVAVLKGK